MTRREAAMISSSPRSLAASRTIQAASSEDDSGANPPASKKALISAATLRRCAILSDDRGCSVRCMVISMRLRREVAIRASLGERIALARLIERQDAAGCIGVEAVIFRRQLA